MAITLLGDLLPYTNQMRQGYIDEATQIVNVFNGASAGTITLHERNITGTLNKIAFFKDFGTVARRDITSMSDQTAAKIERDEHTDFRTYFKFEPVQWTDESFWTADRMKADSVAYMIGTRLARARMQEAIKQAISIVAAAIESQGADTTLDLTTPTPSNFLQPEITKARSLWGARFNDLRLMVMHSSVFFPLVQNQTMNSSFDLGAGITLYGGTPGTMGQPILVVDNPALIYEDDEGEARFKTLLLTQNAVNIGDDGFINAALAPVVGKENLGHWFQAEWSMWNNVKGYQLKASANPQSNPSDATLTNPSNWTKWVADKHNTAGVLVKSIADLNAVTQVLNVKVVS